MATYEIKELFPSNEEGFVYADVIVNGEETPRKLIIPETVEEAQFVLSKYVTAEENQPVVPAPVIQAAVTELIGTPIEVLAPPVAPIVDEPVVNIEENSTEEVITESVDIEAL